MLLKGFLCLFIQAMLHKAVFSQCIPPKSPVEPLCPSNLPFERYNAPVLSPIGPLYGRVVGGNLIVDTSAPYAPTGPAGVSIFSDNLLIEGPVMVTGNLPFEGTIALEGILPSTGTSSVSYTCGTGNVGIEAVTPVSEGVLPVRSLLGVH